MGYSILIVDDDTGLRSLYRMILEKEGYEIVEATNGADALKLLVNYTPDVIILDMLMPLLGGEAVLKRIQQMPALQRTKIIVASAYPRFQESALDLNAVHFLVKPVQPDDIVDAVASVLGD